MAKISLYLNTMLLNRMGRVEVNLHSFLTAALDRESDQCHAPVASAPQKESQVLTG
jgi:hypothetical protein